ncbi:MAG: GatB/YqeY domain-containing protein [Patescibacteria group bacterium]
MTLKEQITEDMKNAMRAHDAEKLGTIRLLLSEIKNYEIDNGPQDDAGVQKIVARMVKQFSEVLSEFKNAGRQDLVDENQARIAVLELYLPAQMNDQELEQIVREVIAESGMSQPGPVIGMVMKKVAGQADGGRVAQVVKQVLG